jgi:CMP-N-acetylneuraminic acid synthetase
MLEDPVPLLRQQKPVVYARNGPAVVAARTASVMERGLYEGDVRGFEMDHRYSVDIDTELDLELAEFWLGQHRNTHRAEEDG